MRARNVLASSFSTRVALVDLMHWARWCRDAVNFHCLRALLARVKKVEMFVSRLRLLCNCLSLVVDGVDVVFTFSVVVEQRIAPKTHKNSAGYTDTIMREN